MTDILLGAGAAGLVLVVGASLSILAMVTWDASRAGLTWLARERLLR
jgi:hypothetical protein